jgi:hypothetical protein
VCFNLSRKPFPQNALANNGVEELGFLDQRGSSHDGEAACRMLEDPLGLLTTDAWKPLEELIQCGSGLEILEQGCNGNPRTSENPRAAHSIREAFNSRTCRPIQHRQKDILLRAEGKSRFECGLTTQSRHGGGPGPRDAWIATGSSRRSRTKAEARWPGWMQRMLGRMCLESLSDCME